MVDVYKKTIDACPYCGAMEMGMHIGIIDYRVVCPSCSATGPLHEDISTAISLWNTVSKSWFNQSLTTYMPPAKEVSQETCDQLRRENDLLEEMISDRLGSLGELEREGYRGEPEPGGEPGELEPGGDPGELERAAGVAGGDGELERGGDSGELDDWYPPKHNLRVDWFAEQMKHKLELNRHRGGWEDCKNHYLLRRLLEEIAELIQAVMRKEDADTVIEEAADVANFCMMIADNRYAGYTGELERGGDPGKLETLSISSKK